jgi:iron complex transport system permease protein
MMRTLRQLALVLVLVLASAAPAAELATRADLHPRVIAFSPAITKLMFSMGLGNHVVGVTSYCRLPEGSEIPRVGSALSVRVGPILRVEPDVILTQVDLKHFEPVLQIKPDLRVQYIRTESLEDIASAMETIGRIVGKADLGLESARTFREKLQQVRRSVGALPRERVLFVLGYQNPSSPGRGSWIDEMIEVAGGRNVLHDGQEGWRQRTLETLVSLEPDVVFCQCQPGQESEAEKYWKGLGAGKGWPQRVVVVSDADWTLPAGHIADYAAAMARLIHGEAEVAPAGGPPAGAAAWQDALTRANLFRLLAAAAVGAALAAAGLALQGLLRNPLAEPYLLGISSGAGVGVLLGGSLAAALALPAWATSPILAMVGALATTAVVYGIAQRRGRLDPYVLLLSGVIVNVFNGALILTILQFVKQEEMIDFIGWGMGKIPEYLWFRPRLLVFCWLMVLAGWIWLLLRSGALNALGLGDEVAASSGVAVHRVRIEVFLVVSLITAAAVALAGPIGFVGLIVPHLCRLVFGPDHRRLMILSAVGGALFLMAADTLCRWTGEISRHGELPVGVITAMTGGPFFIYLLRRRARGGDL